MVMNTREEHLTKGVDEEEFESDETKADDIHRLPTFHSSLVVPFHGKITGLLPHEYV